MKWREEKMDMSLRNVAVRKKILILLTISVMVFSMIGKPGKGFEQKEDQFAKAEQIGGCEKVGHYDYSNFEEIVVKEDTAYIVAGYNGLLTVDVTDKTNPSIIKQEEYFGYTKCIALEDDFVYVIMSNLSWDHNLLIYDISTPSNPLKISETSFTNYRFYDICVENDCAYLASNIGLCVINLSNPSLPIIIGNLNVGNTDKVFVQNQTLYLNEFDFGINVINISTPTSPELISRYNGSDSGLFTTFTTYNFYAKDELLYATISDGLLVINTTNPVNLTFCNLVELEWGTSITVKIEIHDDYIYLGKYHIGVIILHKNNDTHPLEVGEYDFGAGFLVAEGNYLYLTNGALHIVDITDPVNLSFLGEVGDEFIGYATVLAIDDDYAYLADFGGGLRILDIKDLTKPYVVGHYDGWIYNVKIITKYAYISDGNYGLVILDVSDPMMPTKVYESRNFSIGGIVKSLSIIWDIDIQDNYAYLAAHNNLVILDVSNPETPVAVGSYSSQVIDRVCVVDDKAYILSKEGLEIIDVKDKTNPKKIGNYSVEQLGSYVNDLDVSGNYAIVGCWNTVEILNVKNTADVKKVSSIELQGSTVSIAGRYLCIANRDFLMYDMNNPKTPVEFASFFDSESARCLDPWEWSTIIYNIVVRDGYAYLAHGTNGFVIISLPVTKQGKIGLEYTFTVSSFVAIVTTIVIITRKKRK